MCVAVIAFWFSLFVRSIGRQQLDRVRAVFDRAKLNRQHDSTISPRQTINDLSTSLTSWLYHCHWVANTSRVSTFKSIHAMQFCSFCADGVSLNNISVTEWVDLVVCIACSKTSGRHAVVVTFLRIIFCVFVLMFRFVSFLITKWSMYINY